MKGIRDSGVLYKKTIFLVYGHVASTQNDGSLFGQRDKARFTSKESSQMIQTCRVAKQS